MHDAQPIANRLESIQALRALAALLVLFVHSIDLVDRRSGVDLAELFQHRGFNIFGAVGVDIFFVISGFAMAAAIHAKPQRGAGRFLAERFARIMPFFWLMSLAAAVVLVSLGKVFGVSHIANTVTMIPLWDPVEYAPPILSVGWTLAFEWMFYCVVAVAILCTPPGRAIPFAFLLCLLLGTFGALLGKGPALLMLLVNPMMLEFAGGLALFIAWRGGTFARNPWLGPLLLLVGLAGFALAIGYEFASFRSKVFAGGAPDRFLWWGLPSIAFTAGWLAVWESWIARGGGRRAAWRFLLLLGDASYALYLVHLPFLLAINKALPGFSGRGEWLIAAVMAASILLGLAAHLFVERPLLRTTHSLMFGRGRGTASAVDVAAIDHRALP